MEKDEIVEQELQDVPKRKRILWKFAVTLGIMTVAVLLVSAATIYINQSEMHKRQCEDSLQQVAKHMSDLINADGENFAIMQDYLMEHKAEVDIVPQYAKDFHAEEARFHRMFQEEYPGKIYEKDVKFEDMSEELKESFVSFHFI